MSLFNARARSIQYLFLGAVVSLQLFACAKNAGVTAQNSLLDNSPSLEQPGPLQPGAEQPPVKSPAITDEELLNEAADAGSYIFFQNNENFVPFTKGGGGHSGFIRLRFNAIAASALGPDGRLPVGKTFPEGSIVIKDIKEALDGVIDIIAIMKKNATATNANKDWVWGEYFADGSPVVSASSGGKACIRCHSFTDKTSNVKGDLGHRDYVRYFGLH